MESKKLVTRLKQAPTIGLLLSGTGAQLRTAGTVAEVTSGACGQITTPQKLKNVIVLRGWKPHAEATLENRCPPDAYGSSDVARFSDSGRSPDHRSAAHYGRAGVAEA